ncbi:MAG TPA: ribonuclease P protein component, partial [Bacteroidia bacterium]|nr:ribonuclease P protein component [Bacteroidia bacterium]
MNEGTLRNTFSKAERLCKRKDFELIFSQGAAFNRFPFRVHWLKLKENTSTVPVKIAISVPKRKIRSAVSRNRIKR